MQQLLTHPASEPPTNGDDKELVRLVLTRRLAKMGDRGPTAATIRICHVLALSGSVEVPTGSETIPPIDPKLAERSWPTAATALRRLGMSQAEVRELAEEAVDHGGAFACLERAVLEAFFPAEIWPVVAALIRDGPGIAGQRVTRGLRRYRQTTLPGNRHRPAGPPLQSTIGGLREDARSLMRVLCALRTEGHPAPGLEPWTALPEIRMPSGGRGGIDTSAPRPELVRIAFAKLTAEVAELLGIRPGEDECEAIAAKTPNRLAVRPLFKPLRERVALLLLVLTGGRVTAIAQLMKSDFVLDHKGVAPDFRHGPAIRLRPGKSLPVDVARWKPLPEAAASWIVAYLTVLERGYPIVARMAERDRDRRDPRFSRPPDDYPLLVSDRIKFSPWHAHGIRTMVSGLRPRRSGYRGVKPLIQREDIGNAELPSEHRSYVGYNPHSFRRCAEQLAERAGRIWNDEHPPTGGAPQPEPGLYGSALLDHQPAGDPMRMLYGDRGTEAAYETLSGRAIEVMWELLISDRGSRRRPDLPAIRDQAAALRAVEAQIQSCEERVARIHASERMPLPPKRVAKAPPSGTSTDGLLRILHSQNAALAESHDLLHQRVDRSERTIRELLGLATATSALRERREQMLSRLTELVYEQRTWEIVADSEPPGADRIEISLPALLAGEQEIDAPPALREPAAVRDWLTFSEFAEVLEIGNRSTVSRWAEGTKLPREEHRRPWDAGAAPVDESLGRNWRRIWVPGVRESFWPTEGTRRRVAELLRHWPQKQGWSRGVEPGERCRAALELPEPHQTAINRRRSDSE